MKDGKESGRRADGGTVTATENHEGAAAAPAPPMARGASFGRYLVLERLGGGGMGVVYAAYDPDLDRKVAVKILRPDVAREQSRLVREARAMARVQHPNVIAVHDVGTFEGRVFLAMELVDGGTLSDWLDERGRSWRETLDVFVQAGRGLAAAHAVGLVHRDFKPSNVLVGKDGRVRVVDFGLARGIDADGDAAEPATAPTSLSPSLSDTITRTGAVLGTPTYMSPEQLLGRPADGKSDQFSFSVALYRALYGERPFGGEDLATITDAVTSGRIKAPPRETRVPGWVREIVVRGLATRPADRWPSMDALLAALSHDPARLRRRWLWAGAAVAAAALLLVGYRGLAGRELRACRGGDDQAAGLWNDAHKRAVERAFAATKRPFAADAFAAVSRALDGYVGAWSSTHAAACEMTHQRGEQSAELLDLRMECLERRRDALATFEELLAHADGAVVDNAVAATQRLPPVEDCANSALVRASIRPALDVTVRARLDPLRQRMARAWATDAAGRYRDALAAAEPLLADARALGYRPIEAEALLLVGSVQHDLDDDKAASPTLRAAVLAADACRHDEIAARAATLLVKVVAEREAQPAQARDWAQRAEAALEALGGNERIEAQLFNNHGVALFVDDKFDEARPLLQKALALRQRIYGEKSIPVASVLDNLGGLELSSGHYPEAIDDLQRAVAMKEALVGRNHPALANSLENLGAVFNTVGRYAEALAAHRRAAGIEESARGESVALAQSLNNIAMDLYGLDRFAESLATYQRSLAITERLLGPDHPQVAARVTNMATTYNALERYGEGEAALTRARDIYAKHGGADSTNVLYAEINLGNALRRDGKLDEARALFERVRATATRIVGADHPLTAAALNGLGKCLLLSHQPAAAIAPLEQSLAIYRKRGTNAERLASIELDLARSLWAVGRRDDARRAWSLGRKDVRALPSSTTAHELETWAVAHR